MLPQEGYKAATPSLFNGIHELYKRILDINNNDALNFTMEFAFTVSFKFTSSWLSFAILFILIVFPDENICVFHCTSLEQSRPRARETGYETLFLCHSSTLDLYTESLIV